jgi:hypothetical protein
MYVVARSSDRRTRNRLALKVCLVISFVASEAHAAWQESASIPGLLYRWQVHRVTDDDCRSQHAIRFRNTSDKKLKFGWKLMGDASYPYMGPNVEVLMPGEYSDTSTSGWIGDRCNWSKGPETLRLETYLLP